MTPGVRRGSPKLPRRQSAESTHVFRRPRRGPPARAYFFQPPRTPVPDSIGSWQASAGRALRPRLVELRFARLPAPHLFHHSREKLVGEVGDLGRGPHAHLVLRVRRQPHDGIHDLLRSSASTESDSPHAPCTAPRARRTACRRSSASPYTRGSSRSSPAPVPAAAPPRARPPRAWPPHRTKIGRRNLPDHRRDVDQRPGALPAKLLHREVAPI